MDKGIIVGIEQNISYRDSLGFVLFKMSPKVSDIYPPIKKRERKRERETNRKHIDASISASSVALFIAT